MRAFSERTRGILALLLALAMIIPAPALSADAGPPTTEGDGPSEGKASGPVGGRATAKWTYMVYMSADNNLEDEAILNVNQMEAVGSSDELNIVIQLDRSPEWDETNGNWSDTRRFLVLPDTDPDIINSQQIGASLGEVDMGNPDRLRDFVVWAVTNYPADRYYLDVWGHGGGWRDGTCNDYTSGSVIDTDELGRALAAAGSMTNETLDVIGFDQCLMAQMEVFYEIKRHADVLVGAESLIPAEGYNYTRIFEPLAADPDMTGEDLADVVVSTFFDEYGHDNDRAHSAGDAEVLDARLAPALTRFAQLLRANASSLRDEIKLARDNAQTYSTLDYIDLGNFTEQLLRTLPANETELRQAAVEVRENVTAAVVAEDHGIGRSGSTGLSFYFPRYGVAWSYGNIKMSQEGRWDEFLDAYFDRRDRPNEAPTVKVDAPLPGSVVGLEFTMAGKANDTDGNVSSVEWKADRGPWESAEAGDEWQVVVSTDGLDPGLHRFSVRSRDDDGDYSPEVQFTLNVESKGVELVVRPEGVRTYAGGTVTADMDISAFGSEGGDVRLEVFSASAGWTVDLPFTQVTLGPMGSESGQLAVTVSPGSDHGDHQVIVRSWMVGAPLIQSFAVLRVEVTDRWADLVVTDVGLDTEDPGEGENVTITVNVTNTGLAPALSFDVEVQHLLDPGVNGSRTVLRRLHVERLDVGESLNISITWTATIGTHEFIGVADSAMNNSDLHPADNILSRTMVLHGYAVTFGAFPTETNVTPGETVHFSLTLRNSGNQWDTLVLSHVNSTLGWEVRFNTTLYPAFPKHTYEADMWVDVPSIVTGGTVEWITIRLASNRDPSKYEDIVLNLLYPETFGLTVTQDRERDVLGPLATDSYNLTVENTGNGNEVYDLEYTSQLDHLFISAVNDSVEIAPGCATTVEVFYSTMDTDVGGQSFEFEVRVRSRDDPTTLAVVSFSVTVARVFGLSGEVQDPGTGLEVMPGTPLVVTLSLTGLSNYPMELEVELIEGTTLFDPPQPGLGPIAPGATEEYHVILVPRAGVLMGEYDILFSVHEAIDVHNATSLGAAVEVVRWDASILRVEDADETVLRPGVKWYAQLMLENDGNHPETYTINTSFVPKWLRVELSTEEVTLAPYSDTLVGVTVWLRKDEFQAPETVMLVVNANPANGTSGSPSVVLDVALDVPSPDDGAPWWLVVTLLVATVVALVALLLIRSGRLRS